MPITVTTLADGRQELTGSTYDRRDEIRALGGRWDPAAKTWTVPAGKDVSAILVPLPKPVVVAAAYVPPRRNRRHGDRCCDAATMFFASSDPYAHYGPASYRCVHHGVSHSTYSGT
jgi:hypothetical protein